MNRRIAFGNAHAGGPRGQKPLGFSIPGRGLCLDEALHRRRRERLALHPPRGQATAAAPRFAILAIVVRLHPATAWISE
jgi:hypothetical protein